MRLWSIHPRYLDRKGLVALWREALLAQKVLQGKTKGYKHHPQLARFKTAPNPVSAIARYLREVRKEGLQRGYVFDGSKIAAGTVRRKIKVTSGQMHYELTLLRGKTQRRDRSAYAQLLGVKEPEPHPLFTKIPGEVEAWEVVRPRENR